MWCSSNGMAPGAASPGQQSVAASRDSATVPHIVKAPSHSMLCTGHLISCVRNSSTYATQVVAAETNSQTPDVPPSTIAGVSVCGLAHAHCSCCNPTAGDSTDQTKNVFVTENQGQSLPSHCPRPSHLDVMPQHEVASAHARTCIGLGLGWALLRNLAIKDTTSLPNLGLLAAVGWHECQITGHHCSGTSSIMAAICRL